MSILEKMPTASEAFDLTATAKIRIENIEINKLVDYCWDYVNRAIADGFFWCDIEHNLFDHDYVRNMVGQIFTQYGYHVYWHASTGRSLGKHIKNTWTCVIDWDHVFLNRVMSDKKEEYYMIYEDEEETT